MTPNEDRDSTVAIETGFDDSGQIYKIPNRRNQPFTNKFEDEYKQVGMEYAMTDQMYPIAVVPRYSKDFKPGKENPFAGKGNYYLMIYGPYCVAMNCTSKKIRFPVPAEFVGAEIISGSKSTASKKQAIEGKETLVLYRKQ